MILITYHCDAHQHVQTLSCQGHANFPSENDDAADLVCAAVSALTGYLGLTLSQTMGFPNAVTADNGSFWFTRPTELNPTENSTLNTLLAGWLLAIKGLEENYSGWVKLEESRLHPGGPHERRP